MRIRTLVPALAILAAPLTAAETSAVKIDGFVDSTWAGETGKTTATLSGTSADEKTGLSSQFAASAKLGVGLNISDKVKAQVDVFFNGNEQHFASTGSQIDVRNAYGTWAVTPDLTFKSGKFISAIGWTSAWAPGLYRIGTGPIFKLYGSDEIGAGVTYVKGDCAIEFDVTNGFFGEGYNNTSANEGGPGAANQGKNAYAYTADATYTLPGKKGTVDVEAVWDVNGGLSGAGASGDGYHLAANTTLTPSEPLTVGAEVIWQKLKAPKDATGQDDASHLGLLGMANFKLAGTPIPMSVTAMAQYVSLSKFQGELTDVGVVQADKGKVTELSVALLTQPAGTDRFGVNAELSYTMLDAKDGVKATSTSTAVDEVKVNSFGIALEAIYVLP